MDNDEIKKKISFYYLDHFDPSSLLKLINNHPFQYREFGYQSFQIDPRRGTYGFYRNLNFRDAKHLSTWAGKVKPRKLYLGAQYKDKIKKSIDKTEWNSTDLKFDIDLDDAEEIRKHICDCHGKQMCNKCFEVAKEAAMFLIEVLDHDFASKDFPCYKENAMIVLSGTKGIHVHYPIIDRLSNNIKEEEKLRRFIITYIQMVSEKKRSSSEDFAVKIIHNDFISRSLSRHFSKYIAKWFIEKTPLDHLSQLQWYEKKIIKKRGTFVVRKGKRIKKETIIKILKKIQNDLKSNDSIILNQSTIESYGLYYPTFFSHALIHRYPRYDGVITFDLKRIIKVPYSVDGSTGRIVEEINYKKLWDISLRDLLTIDHFV